MALFGGGKAEKGPYRYPLERTSERRYDPSFAGAVYTWDIDKTYLDTRFEDLRGLLSIPFETALDKRSVPGAAALLRALRRGPGGAGESAPIYFVSASPPQMRSVIERKMLLDAVEYDGITFKDHLAHLKRGQLGKLTEQVGFKVSALILNRLELPEGARESLFGDDAEQDALAYSIYADVLAGRLRGARLVRALKRAGVRDEDRGYLEKLAGELPAIDRVDRAFIRLARATEPVAYGAYGPGVVPARDCFQVALALLAAGRINEAGLAEVGREILERPGASDLDLLTSSLDAYRRSLVPAETLGRLAQALQRDRLLPVSVELRLDREEPAPPVPPRDGGWWTPQEYIE